MKTFNFSAGPAMLPAEVMEAAQKEFCNYDNTGSGIMELSHRGPQFSAVIEQAEANIRKLMKISDDYAVCFVQGGASMQFAMIPMNLMLPGQGADYADTGTWSAKAAKEAERFGPVNYCASSKASGYDKVPVIRHWKVGENPSYVHITSNNTVAGTQYHSFPDTGDVPLIADMSSDIMSHIIDINQFGMIYAGAQKNLGPSGVALVIIRKDLADRVGDIPTMLRYKTYIEKDSMFNTPPTYAIYMLKKVTDWMLAQGGIENIEKINDMKSEALYELIDRSCFYRSPVDGGSRSRMNIVYRLPTEELEAQFVKEAVAAGLSGLKGHRSVGGIRASIYNAMPLAGVETLIDFMIEFENKNG
jgi:phosphoserine aminotransferase